ncbi:MAG: hydantoinase/oxoprolinase family protein [Pseudomonadota bacterium]
MAYRIGADVGGTFTDIVLSRDDGSRFLIGKVLTTPDRPDAAIIAGIRDVMERSGVQPSEIAHVIHGTTLFTNALIERKGARTALITTKGFRDAIEIGREHRYDMYDLFMQRPEPLAPRYHRFEVDERVLADGSIRKTLDEDEVRAVAKTLKAEGIEAVAVSLIHSYVNDAHEKAIQTILQEAAPEIVVSISSDLVPEIREFDRTSTTLANVYVKGIAEQYLARLKDRLASELGLSGELFIMQSNGGVCEADEASRYPILCVESGPAAGALAAAHYGALLGHNDVLSFDMGGTTAKASVIVDGIPLITNEFEVDRQYQFKKGSGLPVKVPVIEMIEIGTGGGSIAKVDAMKRLQVGPESAGSVPGPVAYNRGGTNPTITDADLILGYLDPEFFLGGEMQLDVETAKTILNRDVGTLLGLELLQAAWGVHQMANENMASAARIHAIERGKDVRRFPLFAFGGAGPVHAFGVARILRSPRVIYPLGAGVMSAAGFMTAPLALQFVRSNPSRLDTLDWDSVNALLADMEEQGRAGLEKSLHGDAITFERFADMRYVKQGYEVRASIAGGVLDQSNVHGIQGAFEAAYSELYGHTMNADIEVVSWRVIARGPKPRFDLPELESGTGTSAQKGERQIYLPDRNGLHTVPVYDRYKLDSSTSLSGPAIIEERESTVVINGEADITVDRYNNLIADLKTS